MLTLLTTSFTIKTKNDADYIDTGTFFQPLIAEFFDLEIMKHPDYEENIFIFSLTYPAYQAVEYAKRIMEFCVMHQKDLMPNETCIQTGRVYYDEVLEDRITDKEFQKGLEFFNNWIDDGYDDLPF